MSVSILLVGGAGYVGSSVSYVLAQQGYRVVVLDAFLHDQQVPQPWATVVRGDCGDTALVTSLIREHHITAVMHFAALIEVGLSVTQPADFYYNNVVNTLRLLDVLRANGVQHIIFSSTCAIYGLPQTPTLAEDHPFAPINPYGRTKLAVEYMLSDYAHAYGMRYVSLRYFNAAGALPEVGIGEQHQPETHVIPLLFKALDQGKPFTIYGTDYDTPDGTCIRDYIHIHDLALAHLKALQLLQQGAASAVFNLGSGTGCSVQQLVAEAEKVSQRQARIIYSPRRPGDAPVLVANIDHARCHLSWQPHHSSLPTILHAAWQFYQAQKTIPQEQVELAKSA